MKLAARTALVSFALSLVLLPQAASVAADSTYEVNATGVNLTAGAKGKANVTIAAKNGWHLNAEAPLTLKLAPEPGITVDKEKLVRSDLAESTDAKARFDVNLTAAEHGTKNVQAEAAFVLCQEQACRPVKEKVSFAVDVRAPEASDAKATKPNKPAKGMKKK